MTLFLSALAGSLLFGVLLWKLGQRAPRPVKDRGQNTILQAAGGLVYVLFLWSITPARYVVDAWIALGAASDQMQAGDASDLAALARTVNEARFDLAAGAAASTVLLGCAAFFIYRLIKAFMRRSSKKAAQPQETHA